MLIDSCDALRQVTKPEFMRTFTEFDTKVFEGEAAIRSMMEDPSLEIDVAAIQEDLRQSHGELFGFGD